MHSICRALAQGALGTAVLLGLFLQGGCGSSPILCYGPNHDRDLEARLSSATAGFRGTVGIYVRHLRRDRRVEILADEPFPTASLIKVPILCALMERVDRGELSLSDELVYEKAKRLYPGEDLLGAFADGEKITIEKLVMLMLTMSDNTASLWLQELAGTGASINDWLDRHHFPGIRMNSRTPGRESDRERFGWGQTTPREMAELMVAIREGRAGSPAATESMHRALTRSYWNKEALSQIPPDIAVMSKQGAVDRSRSEVALVHGKNGDYVFCVITKEQADESWTPDNEGFALLRKVSAILWDAFENSPNP
jgi:beta-lactamase class A